jgi:hypothetical protein
MTPRPRTGRRAAILDLLAVVVTGGVDGRWTVDTAIGAVADGSGTFVGYRVQEQLATIGATEAVRRTSSVTGSITQRS